MDWFTRMSLRGRVLSVGSVLAVALIAVGVWIPVPYVAEGPGVSYNTLGSVGGTEMITFKGKEIPKSVDEKFADPGTLNMTAVSITSGLPLFAALGLWGQGEYALIPREDQFPPNLSVEQVNKQNAEMFAESQSAAEISALSYLKYPSFLYAGDISGDGASAGVLDPHDRITQFDGTPVKDVAALIAAVGKTKPGEVATVTVMRDGRTRTEKVKLGTNPQHKDVGALGIAPVQRPKAPFQVDITLNRIGGPSAGLMFTLGIIDKLTSGDLASGHAIAGTGEIQPYQDLSKSPVVGAIGGIVQKLITAKDEGATVFLVPAPNCAEAMTRVPRGLQLVKVATLDDAMTALKDLKDGTAPPGC